MSRFGDRYMVGVDRHRRIAGQARVGTGLVDDHSSRRALSFIEDKMFQNGPAVVSETAIGGVDTAQGGIISGQHPSNRRGLLKRGFQKQGKALRPDEDVFIWVPVHSATAKT